MKVLKNYFLPILLTLCPALNIFGDEEISNSMKKQNEDASMVTWFYDKEKFEDFYKKFKYPIPLPMLFENIHHKSSIYDFVERYKTFPVRKTNCPDKKHFLIHTFSLFTKYFHNLYFNFDRGLWDICSKEKLQGTMWQTENYKKEVFKSVKQIQLLFPNKKFPTEELTSKAQACHKWMLETATHYMNLGSFHYSHLDLLKMNIDFYELQETIFTPIDESPGGWIKSIEDKCSFFKDRYSFQGNYIPNILHYDKNKILAENSVLLTFFKERAEFILSSNLLLKEDASKIKKTITCFESWPKQHYELLLLDNYSGFFYDYGRKFIFKDHEKIDPEFKSVLDYYYKSLFQSDLFSLRLNDVYNNCSRLSKIQSSEFEYENIWKKYGK